MEDLENLKSEIERLRRENLSLRNKVKEYEEQSSSFKELPGVEENHNLAYQKYVSHHLNADDLERYGRQLILNEIGVKGQEKILNSKVLIVGAGGLGCPVSLYLAGAGVQKLGIVDYDVVEKSNLHRQVLHTEQRIGMSKAESIKLAILKFNSSIQCEAYTTSFSSQNAMDIVNDYDIVVDASDNVATRYLLNDVCVLKNKVLVSGSALRLEGQVTVYNYQNGPCYRCLFPKPPPPETVTDCSSGGVLGVVTGIIGCIQALEVLKIILNMDGVLSQKLLLFDASSTRFQTVKLRPKNKDCSVCGENPTIKELIDYVQFCGSGAHDKAKTEIRLDSSFDKYRIHSQTYQTEVLNPNKPHLLVDVREPIQFELASLKNSKNIPLKSLFSQIESLKLQTENNKIPIYLICRRGNDSQDALKILVNNGFQNVYNIDGGLLDWTNSVDPNFPRY